MQIINNPKDIEKESFRIIGEELARQGITLASAEEPIIKRVIHTTADFEYAKTLHCNNGLIEIAINALLSRQAMIVTDTAMALAGINKRACDALGVRTACYIGDDDVAREAREAGITRSAAAVRKMAREARAADARVIFANGNAPTAAIEAAELLARGELALEAMICVPVGFVNVEYAKERIAALPRLPSAVAMGRKGGSNVAAAIVNALLYMAEPRKKQLQ